MRSMRVEFIFRNRAPSLKVHHGQCLTCLMHRDRDRDRDRDSPASDEEVTQD